MGNIRYASPATRITGTRELGTFLWGSKLFGPAMANRDANIKVEAKQGLAVADYIAIA